MFSQEFAIIENHIVSMISQRPSIGQVDEILAMVIGELLSKLRFVVPGVDSEMKVDFHNMLMELIAKYKLDSEQLNFLVVHS